MTCLPVNIISQKRIIISTINKCFTQVIAVEDLTNWLVLKSISFIVRVFCSIYTKTIFNELIYNCTDNMYSYLFLEETY